MPLIPTEIIQRLNDLNVEVVARALGLNVNKHVTRCFMHDDCNPSLKFHKNGHLWKCFVCDVGGGPIKLVMRYLNIEFVEACMWLSRQFGIYVPDSINITQKTLPPLKQYNSEYKSISSFNQEIGNWIIENAGLSREANLFLICERKLSPEIVKSLNIKSINDSKRFVEALVSCFLDNELINAGFIKVDGRRKYLRLFTPCLLFPYYDTKGILVGIQTRYIGCNKSAPRFQFISGFKPTIYNKQILSELLPKQDLYISEGVTDCLALLSNGYKAIALPSATNLPLNELRALCQYNLIMSVDRDLAGERAYETLSYQIVKMGGKIRRMDFPLIYKDYGEYYKATHK